MSRKLKLVLYAVCLVGVFVLGAVDDARLPRGNESQRNRVQRLERAAVSDNTNAVEKTTTTDTNLVAGCSRYQYHDYGDERHRHERRRRRAQG